MNIQLAETDSEIERCFPVMVQLRPKLAVADFPGRIRRQFQDGGYRLVYLEEENQIKAVGGFRISEMLFSGRFLYVDDLITDTESRSKGYGGALLDWLIDYAKSQGCEQFELDSGVQRAGAHRFYFSKRMEISSYHFSLKLRT